ncbi:ABC transporter substrate-binding protein [Paenibacillus thalictri]|uniref:Extracellular solute-binding protein n=1 Tax=Paenibacillus thalictri TaxID=2527873 RepID=A0A4Q9DNI8_9BACL|nr:extracellular solute-binding protein [Paenibacillus thalictri]TBL76023.1 extracellular solute-binding protein [Paenibacillus thalictri]
MKKSFKVIAGVLVASTALAGCGGQATDKGGTQGAAQGGTPAASGPVTIKIHSWYTKDQMNLDTVVAAFNKKFPDIKVEYVGLSEKGDSNEAAQKLDLAAASGEAMDVIMLSNPPAYAQRVGVGMFAPLDDYLKKDNINYKDEYKADTALNGKYYALPGKVSQWFVLLNKDALDEAKLPVPTEWTWQDYQDYAKKLTKGEGAAKRYGAYFHNWKEFATLALANDPKNNYIVTADGSPNLDNDRERYSLQMRNQMENVDKTAVPYFDVISQKMNYRDVYFGGKAAMLPIGDWMIPETGGSATVTPKFKTVFAPYPKYQAGDENGLTNAGMDYIGIAQSSKNKDAAWKFIRWYSTEGIVEQGRALSGWTKADLNKNVEAILATAKAPDMVDKTSLLSTLKVGKPASIIVPPEFAAQAEKDFLAQVELFLTGKQDLEKTIKASVDKINSLKASAKK